MSPPLRQRTLGEDAILDLGAVVHLTECKNALMPGLVVINGQTMVRPYAIDLPDIISHQCFEQFALDIPVLGFDNDPVVRIHPEPGLAITQFPGDGIRLRCCLDQKCLRIASQLFLQGFEVEIARLNLAFFLDVLVSNESPA